MNIYIYIHTYTYVFLSYIYMYELRVSIALKHIATHCNTLQHSVTHYNTLQHTVTHCRRWPCYTPERDRNTVQNKLQHTASHCNTLQHTATQCNTLQHTTYFSSAYWEVIMSVFHKKDNHFTLVQFVAVSVRWSVCVLQCLCCSVGTLRKHGVLQI